MATMNISLPDKMKQWAEKGHASGFIETTIDDLYKEAEELAKARRKTKKSAWFSPLRPRL